MRHWDEPPWEDARTIVVPEGSSYDPELINAQNFRYFRQFQVLNLQSDEMNQEEFMKMYTKLVIDNFNLNKYKV